MRKPLAERPQKALVVEGKAILAAILAVADQGQVVIDAVLQRHGGGVARIAGVAAH